MRRSRLTGHTRSTSKDTEFGWYFAGEPMDKRRPRSSRVRLVRYIPETETCVHSRYPTPYPNRDTVVCTCGSRCELHSPETRAPSPTSSVNSSFEPALRCKSCGGFHILKQEPSPQVERLVCSCSRREIYIKEVRPRSPSKSLSSSSDYNSRCGCDSCRGVENRRERPREPRPISPTSSDSSNYGRTAGSRGRRAPARRPDTAPGAERPREAPTPPMTPAPSAKPTSTRPSTTTLHAAPIIHHHCSQAAYCEEHPELCRAMPSPVPLPPSMRTQSGQSTPKSQPGSRTQPTPRQLKCTCGGPASGCNFASRLGISSPRGRAGYCACCSWMERYLSDESGSSNRFSDDTASDSSVHAMAGDDRDDIESLCPLHHRCYPRFEPGHGWFCGRK